MKKTINRSTLIGKLYQHNLEIKTAGPTAKTPGAQYIRGTIDIATDDACTNTVTVRYSYVTPNTKKGSANPTYLLLENIISGKIKNIVSDGVDTADIIKVDTSIGLNEFFTDKNGDLDFVSTKINDGGFAVKLNTLNPDDDRNIFECDMVITNVRKLEATDTNPEKTIIKGAVFNFRGMLLPVEFSVTDAKGQSYFEGLDISSQKPLFTKVKGKQISETIVREEVEESAFGDNYARKVKRTRKDFVVDWVAKEPYEWDSDATLTAAELTKAMKDREIYLAELKQRYTESKSAPKVAPAVSAGGFAF